MSISAPRIVTAHSSGRNRSDPCRSSTGACSVAGAACRFDASGTAVQPRPKAGSMTSEAFSKAQLARMHDVMAGHVASGRMPGLVTLVSRRGETHVDAIGTLAFGASAPMRRDTLFRIASISKPVTAAAAMMLVEEGRLRLDDPVDQWLPELANRKVLRAIDAPLDDTVPAKRAITLRDLLTFRLGLGAVMVFPAQYPIQKAMEEAGVAPGPYLPQVGPDELMRRYGSLPLIHQPGEKWLYDTGSRHPRHHAGARHRQVARRAAHRAHLRAARHEGYRLPCAGGQARSARHGLLDRLQDRRAHRVRRGGRPVRQAAGVRVGERRAGLDGRRLSRLQPHDAESRPARRHAHPVAHVGRADDHRPHRAGAEGGLAVLRKFLGQSRLGVRALGVHPARRPPWASAASAGTAAMEPRPTWTRRRTWSAS